MCGLRGMAFMIFWQWGIAFSSLVRVLLLALVSRRVSCHLLVAFAWPACADDVMAGLTYGGAFLVGKNVVVLSPSFISSSALSC